MDSMVRKVIDRILDSTNVTAHNEAIELLNSSRDLRHRTDEFVKKIKRYGMFTGDYVRKQYEFIVQPRLKDADFQLFPIIFNDRLYTENYIYDIKIIKLEYDYQIEVTKKAGADHDLVFVAVKDMDTELEAKKLAYALYPTNYSEEDFGQMGFVVY